MPPKSPKNGWGDARCGGAIHVASSTAPGPSDYHCRGTNDDVEIQAALNALDGIKGK